MGYVQLNHFVASTLSGVRYGCGYLNAFSGLDGGGILQRSIPEGSITQAIAERISYIAFEITIRTVCHRIILEIRKILVIHIGSQRHTAGRVIVAKENIGNGIAGSLSAVPGLQDRIGIAALPVEAHHGTGHIDQD